MLSRIAYGLSALLIGAGALTGVQFSSAEWTGQSNTEAVIAAAPDWTPPMVAVDDPGYAVWGTTTISATASDSISAVASVLIEYRQQGSSTWTELCTDLVAPFSCSWNTTTVTDGVYFLRATALDSEGNSHTSDELMTEVRNTPSVVIDPVATPTRGTVRLTARVVNVGTGLSTITFQGAQAGSGAWVNLVGCTGPGPEAFCDFDSTMYPSGTYDLRAVATVGVQVYTDVQPNILVDNTAPSVSLTVPASPLSGTVSLTSTASDTHTSISSVLFEYRLGAGAWVTCGSGADTDAPYACDLGTTLLDDGSYGFRATATDAVGNVATTATATRTVDNTAPAVSLSVPAGPLTGQVSLTATASDSGTGVDTVDFQHRVQGDGPWSSCGTDDTSPYACTFDTNTVPNGTHEFRAVAADFAGHVTTTAVQTVVVQTLVLDLADLPYASNATTYPLSATWSGSTATNVLFERSPNGVNTWTSLSGCTAVSANPTAACSWTLPANGTYFVRASTTFGSQTYSETQSIIVDKAAPSSASITVPATNPLNGTVTLTGTGADALSGVGSMLFEYKLSSGSTWVACGTDTSSPYSCDLNTGTLTDANYDFRATAVDRAGNSRVSTAVTNRAVNSAITSVSVTSPVAGGTVTGTTTVAASVTSNKSITSVLLQYRTVGGSTWTNVCAADTVAPYSCSWDTSALAYGAYEVQAVVTHTGSSYNATSAAVSFTVDRFQGSSVDATPGTNSGLPGDGDTVVLTYTGQAKLDTIKSGLVLNTPSTVAVTIKASNVAGGPAASGDYMSFPGTNLGFVTFGQDYVDNGQTVTFGNSTITASTISLGGVSVTRVTVNLSARTDTGTAGWLNDTNNNNGLLTWTPNAAVLDQTDRACNTAPVTRASGVNL